MAYWHHMLTYIYRILVNIGSGNGFMPDGIKPLPEAMLTYHGEVPDDIHLSSNSYEMLKPYEPGKCVTRNSNFNIQMG